MLNRMSLAAASVLILAGAAHAQELENPAQKFSYTMGYQMGLSLRQSGTELDTEVLVQGLRDALGGTEPKMSRNQMDEAIAAQRAALEAQRQAQASVNLEKSQAFLEQNKARDGVLVTDSGLQYEVLNEGEGDKPELSDTVVVHYEGSLPDGSVFDSSYERDTPATLPLNGVIKGWQEGLRLMSEGAKYKLYVPAELGYGEGGAGNRIGPNQALIFEVELLEIK